MTLKTSAFVEKFPMFKNVGPLSDRAITKNGKDYYVVIRGGIVQRVLEDEVVVWNEEIALKTNTDLETFINGILDKK